MRPWDLMHPSARKLEFQMKGTFARMARYFLWQYGWGGREYGLLLHDQAFEPDPEVAEALRRLNLKEPWEFDQRKIRLIRAHNLAMHHEKLPKDQWTRYEQETYYLKPYLDEISAEKKIREDSSGLIPGFMLRKRAEESH